MVHVACMVYSLCETAHAITRWLQSIECSVRRRNAMRLYSVWILVYTALLLSLSSVLLLLWLLLLVLRFVPSHYDCTMAQAQAQASDRNARFRVNHGMRNTRYLFIVIIWTWITPKLVAAVFHTEREMEMKVERERKEVRAWCGAATAAFVHFQFL